VDEEPDSVRTLDEVGRASARRLASPGAVEPGMGTELTM
jgi:hypothetical protein